VYVYAFVYIGNVRLYVCICLCVLCVCGNVSLCEHEVLYVLWYVYMCAFYVIVNV